MEGRVGLPKGTLLDGSYRIERAIGSGGFGITYEAEDVHLGTRVAIKEYYPGEFGHRDASLSVRPTSEKQKATFEWGRTSFLTEARTLARFRHPSVVQVTRVFEAYSTAYMVMIFEEGPHLEAWLKHLGRAPTQEELDRIAGPLLDALEMMHVESFLHRDIAPDNIIVRPDETPVLLDFGAARQAVAGASRSITGIVKAGYSPQEQYTTDARLQGPWTDVYALGATLYRAVTGRAPEESTLRAIDDRMLPAVSAGEGRYRPSFLTAIDVCLAVHHSERPQSVRDLRPMLLGQKKQLKSAASINGAVSIAFASRAVTRRWLATAAAVLTLLGGAYAGFEYTRWRSSERGTYDADAAARAAEAEARRKAAADAAERQAILEAEEKRKEDERRQWAALEETRRKEEQVRQRAEAAAAEKRKTEEEEKRQTDAAAAQKKAEEAEIWRGWRLTPQVGHTHDVFDIAVMPDTRIVLSGGKDQTVKLWDIGSGRLIRTLEQDNPVFALAVSPDGRIIASGNDRNVNLWDAGSGRLTRTLEGHSDWVKALAVSPDGRTIVSGSKDETVRLWDAASGRLIRTFKGHDGGVTALAVSPDGRTIISGQYLKMKLWDVASGRLIRTNETMSFQAVAVSPDGRTIVGGHHTAWVTLWDAATGRLQRTLEGSKGGVLTVAVAPDGRTIMSGNTGHQVMLWDIGSGRLIRTLEQDDAVWAVAVTPDGRTIVSSSGRNVNLWDAASGRLIRTLVGSNITLRAAKAAPPDGHWVTIGSDGLTYTGSEGIEHHLMLTKDLESRPLTENFKRLYFRPEGLTVGQ